MLDGVSSGLPLSSRLRYRFSRTVRAFGVSAGWQKADALAGMVFSLSDNSIDLGRFGEVLAKVKPGQSMQYTIFSVCWQIEPQHIRIVNIKVKKQAVISGRF
jgi:hypothetical protein